MVNLETANAFEAGYSYGEYSGFNITIDGKWTNDNEWTYAPWQVISSSAKFAGVVSITGDVTQSNIIEFFTDTTNDAGDYWQICMHNANEDVTAPTANSYRFDIEGHTTLKVYQGTGTGWTLLAPPPPGITWANTLSASPQNSTAHWILEISINKITSPITAQPPIGIRVAVYDASNAAAGVQAWPPTPQDNPSRWGSISGYIDEIPEGFTMGIVVLLSSSAAVGAFYLRRRPKIQICQ
jgi:hypothetical protein